MHGPEVDGQRLYLLYIIPDHVPPFYPCGIGAAGLMFRENAIQTISASRRYLPGMRHSRPGRQIQAGCPSRGLPGNYVS